VFFSGGFFHSGGFFYDLGQLYILILVARALVSWFPPSPGSALNPVRHVLFAVTEPVLAPFRRLIPPIGMIDISYLVAFIVIEVIVDTVLVRLP
jgi:YggT family protein